MKSEEIIEKYLNWLRSSFKGRDINDKLVTIQTPFVDNQNDFILIYVKKDKSNYYITDDGRTIFDLETMGVNLTEKRKSQIKEFVNAQGVKYNELSSEIYVETTEEVLPQRKNDLLQTIINISDMFLVSQSNIKNLFFEEVEEYFKRRRILFNSNVYMSGSGGIKHKIDFLIPREEKVSQIVKTINIPSKEKFENLLFTFIDIDKHNFQYKGSEKIIFINDLEKEVKQEHLGLIKTYGVKPILWSERDLTTVFQ